MLILQHLLLWWLWVERAAHNLRSHSRSVLPLESIDSGHAAGLLKERGSVTHTGDDSSVRRFFQSPLNCDWSILNIWILICVRSNLLPSSFLTLFMFCQYYSIKPLGHYRNIAGLLHWGGGWNIPHSTQKLNMPWPRLSLIVWDSVHSCPACYSCSSLLTSPATKPGPQGQLSLRPAHYWATPHYITAEW